MITISSGLKTALKTAGRELKGLVTDGIDPITGLDDLQGIRIQADSSFCKVVMRECNFKYFGSHTYLGSTVNVKIGANVSGTAEYIDYGDFIVVEEKTDVASGIVTAKAYDHMQDALKEWGLTSPLAYPTTLLGLLQAICTELTWTLATTTFPNSALPIASDLFINQGMTYKEILEMIAEASGSIIYFDEDGELNLRQPSATVLETLTTSNLKTLKIEALYGELNTLVLSRMPQEDNIIQEDAGSIATYGINEFKIVNNYIVDSDRETYITPIWDVMKLLKYYPTETNTVGLGYFEIGDRIKVTNLAGEEFETVITSIDTNLQGGLSETLKSLRPEKTTTPYASAGYIGKTIKNTQIIVDKVEGEITSINEVLATVASIPRQSTAPESPSTNDLWLDTDDNIIYIWDGSTWQPTAISPSTLESYYTKTETDAQIVLTSDEIVSQVASQYTTQTIFNDRVTGVETLADMANTNAQNAQADADANAIAIENTVQDISTLTQSVSELDLSIQSQGGINSLKNSSGLKGTLTEWQEFNGAGALLDARNTALIDQTSDTIANTESGSGFKIINQFIVQTIPTLIGNSYTYYCKFKKDCTTNISITGVLGVTEITAVDYVDDEWSIFKLVFTATDNNTRISIENTTVGGYCIIADSVVKLGDCNNWVQAPNEVYGANFKFDKDGFQITSLTDTFKSEMSNTQFAVYDTAGGSDKTIMNVSKDEAKITKLTAQEEFVIRRYEDPESSVRFIPTATGLMIVVND